MWTQVRMHVVRLYGMEFERPGPRLRDYVRRVQGAPAAAPRACRMLTEIGSQGTCGNRRLPCSRGGGGTARPASHQLQIEGGYCEPPVRGTIGGVGSGLRYGSTVCT